MYLVLYCFFSLSVLLVLLFFFSIILNKSVLLDFQSCTPFECGFNSLSLKRLPFSIHFFLIAVIFLIFDIEVVIIFPIVVVLKYSSIFVWFFMISFFVFILILGLYHEWYNGILNWTF
uniref:NADH-ubiquinone oxidoreductase chain 3 n=1 Tax=Ledropsis sp. 1 XYW-2023a TaxID=3078463 RepID=A0AB38ZHE0_9HEMI